MKIAIHQDRLKGKLYHDNFCERWISYCQSNNIDYKIVCAYDNDIIQQLSDCSAFMWNHHQGKLADILFAKQLLYSLEQKGLKVFPNFQTTWHFDDKVGQKYLLESLNAPLVTSYVFYSKADALQWIDKTSFPKVFKLRGGAGSSNVRLIKNRNQAVSLVNSAFSSGIPCFDKYGFCKEKFRKFKIGKDKLGILKGIYTILFPGSVDALRRRDRGYIYFQDYIPNNKFDIRICVVGDKAFGIRRNVRDNDFRASGSGSIQYEKSLIDDRCVKISFDLNDNIKAQSIAVDYVFDESNNPLIVEISYAFSAHGYDDCEGYWTKDMQWHPGKGFDFCGWMVDLVR